jgi:hypothetical protein
MGYRWLVRHEGSQRAFSYRRRRGALCLRFALAIPLAVGPMLAGLTPGGITQVAAAGTLDQSSPSCGPGVGTGGCVSAFVQGTVEFAQTFTAGISGNLDQVKLFLARTASPPPTGDLTVQIKATAGGMPSGAALASSTVPEASVSTAGGWVSVPLSPPAPSIAGTQYAIVLTAPTTSCSPVVCFYIWQGPTGIRTLGAIYSSA